MALSLYSPVLGQTYLNHILCLPASILQLEASLLLYLRLYNHLCSQQLIRE